MTSLILGLLVGLGATPQEEINTQAPAAVRILDGWQQENPVAGQRKFIITYFTPADRDPAPQYRERLSRTLLDVQQFYRDEMKRNGFGERTVQYEMEPDGLIKIHVVKGKLPAHQYRTESGRDIREECLPVLKSAGLDASKETIAIFCYLADWDDDKKTMRQYSPYYAGGNQISGTAWQVDSPILDSALLSHKEPVIQDGQYGKISIGKYNSIFVGGIAHEFGHALQLPHNQERPDQKALWGTALMGSGNRTYGSDRRGEDERSFLTLSSALRLASHPIFCGSVKGLDIQPQSGITDVQVKPSPQGFTITAKVTGTPPIYGVIASMDPAGHSNYDATTATAVPDAQGRITLHCNALRKNHASMLETFVLHANGASRKVKELSFPYQVDAAGKADLWAVDAAALIDPILAGLNAKNPDQVKKALNELRRKTRSEDLKKAAATLAATLNPPALDLTKVPSKEVKLTEAKQLSASVGWLTPAVNRLPGNEPLLIHGGRLYAHGLYAHAPASYAFNTAGRWNKLTARAGLQDGHGGSVVFVVKGDDRELYRSKTSKEGDTQTIDVDISSVQKLELIVEDGGNGTGSDWGLWLDPVVSRTP